MNKQNQVKIIIAIGVFFFIGLPLLSALTTFLTEALWFDMIGYFAVWQKKIEWGLLCGGLTLIIFAGVLTLNYRMANRLSRNYNYLFLENSPLQNTRQAHTMVQLAAAGAIILLSLIAALRAASAWDTVLIFINAHSFDLLDPIYKNDIGFYIFRLPFYEALQSWFFNLFFWSLVLTLAVYALKGLLAPERFRNWQRVLPHSIRVHLGLLLALFTLTLSGGFFIERYNLLLAPHGAVFGAGFSDVNARLHAHWIMAITSLLISAVFIVSMWLRGNRLPVYTVGLGLLAYGLSIVAYPAFQQQFIVAPNELQKERPFIENNINFTRKAYGLDQISTRPYRPQNNLQRSGLARNQTTLQNVRLWDYRPLLATYRQLQEIRLYYRFHDVDIDRYTIGGTYRQVMLSARELSYDQVPEKAQNWVNQRLKYTHGYGVVMSPVNRITPDGLPEFFIQDIPPQASSPELNITQPAIYYGEKTTDYVFTGTDTPEFDFPQGDKNAFTNYKGQGGVPIGNLWRRLLYAWHFGSLKLLISGYFNENSKVHYHREITNRVKRIAPFLLYDNDPYLVVLDGKPHWVIDAYTTSDRYPYSEPISRSESVRSILQRGAVLDMVRDNVNYVRNSVKVTVDAYNGTVKFFVVDSQDPVLATYRRIFPELFLDSQSIPSNLRAHFRYPEDLFKIQAQMYRSYHMQDAQVFYNQEDLWRFPTEMYDGRERLMEPYYVIMNLPGEEEQAEFLLILPFTPVNKDNMIAWMAARCDGDQYGKLQLYEFPKQELVYGPKQIEARIDQNPVISQQLTLWSQEGSRVIRGDLLVIPIEESLLYVEPIYLRAEQGELPELKRVIVGFGNDIVMEETLEAALNAIFGGGAGRNVTTAAEKAQNPLPHLIQKAVQLHDQTRRAAREGKWAEYGRLQNELADTLKQLKRQSQRQK